jgi:hypothetical protein
LDARFLTPNHTAACDTLSDLPPDKLVDKPSCVGPKDPCEDFIPADISQPTKIDPPPCLKSFPYITCQANAVVADFGKLLGEYDPIKKADIPRIQNKEDICKYTKPQLDELSSTSKRLQTKYLNIYTRMKDLNDCVAKTNYWINNVLQCDGVPQDMCTHIRGSFTEETTAASEKVAQSNQRAEEASKEIREVQNGIDFIFRLYKYTCVNTRR